MTTLYISLGKAGDIISNLSILHQRFVADKQKPNMLVAREFLPLLDRVPFVEAVDWPGSWMNLEGALLWAKQHYDKVIPLSVFGSNFPIEHRTSSFQLESYARAGCLEAWDRLHLAGIARGDKVQFKTPAILLADHSQSSPFMEKEDLYQLLKTSFPLHQIIRLADYKLPHLFDFLAWYDAADAIVCVDSAHLHLTSATSKPVAALTQDKPGKWHGSAFSRRFCFYCRYAEYGSRKAELVECLSDAIEGRSGVEILELN